MHRAIRSRSLVEVKRHETVRRHACMHALINAFTHFVYMCICINVLLKLAQVHMYAWMHVAVMFFTMLDWDKSSLSCVIIAFITHHVASFVHGVGTILIYKAFPAEEGKTLHASFLIRTLPCHFKQTFTSFHQAPALLCHNVPGRAQIFVTHRHHDLDPSAISSAPCRLICTTIPIVWIHCLVNWKISQETSLKSNLSRNC